MPLAGVRMLWHHHHHQLGCTHAGWIHEVFQPCTMTEHWAWLPPKTEGAAGTESNNIFTKKHSKKTGALFLITSCPLLTAVVMVRWSASRRSYAAAAAMTECFLPPSSSPAEQRRAEHQGGVARTPSSEEISPTKFPGLYRTGEPSPPHDGHHHETPDAYVSDDDKEHGKKKNKFKKKEKRSRFASLCMFVDLCSFDLPRWMDTQSQLPTWASEVTGACCVCFSCWCYKKYLYCDRLRWRDTALATDRVRVSDKTDKINIRISRANSVSSVAV